MSNLRPKTIASSGPAALLVACAAVASLVASSVSVDAAPLQAKASGLEPVALIPFKDGSHQEFATIGGREYAFVATGVIETVATLRVIDITQPTKPKVVATLPCGTYQGALALTPDKKTLVLGLDTPAHQGSCMPVGQMGFVTIDISDPTKPKPLGYAINEGGSHSLAMHPKKPIVYNGEGFPDTPGEVQIWSVSNPQKPKLVNTLATGEHSAHDLSFSKDGTMAALASVTSLKLLDTTDPENPTIQFVTQCPGCVHTHEARFTPDGKRLIVNDEFIGSPSACPGGALYFYEVVDLPSGRGLQLVGQYYPSDLVVNENSQVGFCTSHVFGLSSDGTKIAASWHSAGVRYLDITTATGVSFGSDAATPDAAKELGSYLAEDADAFSAKFHKGPYIYVVDLNRGFEILKIQGP